MNMNLELAKIEKHIIERIINRYKKRLEVETDDTIKKEIQLKLNKELIKLQCLVDTNPEVFI
jgi:hypothetical protein